MNKEIVKQALNEALELVYFKQLIKGELLKAINEDKEEPKSWITIKGNHIPIKKGKTKKEAIEEFIQNKENKQQTEDGLIENLVKTIQDSIKETQCNSNEPAEKYPKTIANVSKHLPMNFEQADKGNCNPNYNPKIYEYSHNCQSCVITYEARRRGYNVKAAERRTTGKTAELAAHADWAWIDPQTDKKCEYTATNTNTADEHKRFLENIVKQNERYQYSFGWQDLNNKTYRHVLIVERDSFGDLIIFDPQRGIKYEGNQVKKFLENKKNPKILRIDDKKFNPYFMNEVMQEY